MIYSKKAIDYSAGLDKMSNGTLRPRKMGTWVYTVEELNKLRGWKDDK